MMARGRNPLKEGREAKTKEGTQRGTRSQAVERERTDSENPRWVGGVKKEEAKSDATALRKGEAA